MGQAHLSLSICLALSTSFSSILILCYSLLFYAFYVRTSFWCGLFALLHLDALHGIVDQHRARARGLGLLGRRDFKRRRDPPPTKHGFLLQEYILHSQINLKNMLQTLFTNLLHHMFLQRVFRVGITKGSL